MQEPPGEGTSWGRGQWDSNGMGNRVEIDVRQGE